MANTFNPAIYANSFNGYSIHLFTGYFYPFLRVVANISIYIYISLSSFHTFWGFWEYVAKDTGPGFQHKKKVGAQMSREGFV